jgi:hypothetical protein
MGGNDVSLSAENQASPKAMKAKWSDSFDQFLEEIFVVARTNGFRLTPDQAMAELDEALASILATPDTPEKDRGLTARPRLAVRIDIVALRCKVHHFAVDLFYKTYFPRRSGTEGKSRRGAPPLSTEYLGHVLMLSDRGLKPFEIAGKLGQSDPRGKDRVRKQIAAAKKRYLEIVSNIRKLGAAQSRRNASKRRGRPKS